MEDEVKAYSYFPLSRHTTSPGWAPDRQHRTQPRPLIPWTSDLGSRPDEILDTLPSYPGVDTFCAPQ